MKRLKKSTVDKLPFGSKYVVVEVREVGQSQGMREDWVEKTLYFELTEDLEELLKKRQDTVT